MDALLCSFLPRPGDGQRLIGYCVRRFFVTTFVAILTLQVQVQVVPVLVMLKWQRQVQVQVHLSRAARFPMGNGEIRPLGLAESKPRHWLR